MTKHLQGGSMTLSSGRILLYDYAADDPYDDKKGGAGSGNYGHQGRPGKIGGAGQGGGPVKDSEGKYIPGSVGKTLGIDTSTWDKNSSNAQWAMKKLHKMEQWAAKEQWEVMASHIWSTNAQYPDKYKKAILQAQGGIQALKLKAVTAPPAGTTPAVAPPVPAPVPKWTKVGGQLGSNPGGTYEFEGKKYYVKFPTDPNHARSELLACKLYEAAGARVVKAHLVEVDGKMGIATEWTETKPIQWDTDFSSKAAAQEDFAVHAWLGNRDAIGAPGDMNNVRYDMSTGKPIHVDAGGSMEYRAQGAKKEFTHNPAEWDSMRDPTKAPTASKVFGSMTPDQLAMSANKLASLDNATIDKLVKEYGPGGQSQKETLAITLMARKQAILDKTTMKIDKPAAPTTLDNWDSPLPPAPVVVSKSPMAVPPPPKVASYAQQHGDKMADIYAAAQSGNPAAVQAIKTNGNASSPWPKKVHAYKMQVLSSMNSGGKTNTDHVVTKTTASGKVTIKPESFPQKPVFVSKNIAQKNANEFAVNKSWEAAEKGDLEGLKGVLLTESPKLKTWHANLVSELANQLNPPPPPKTLSESYDKATQHISGKPGKEGLQKIGYWNVLGDVGGIPETLPKGTALPTKMWDVGKSKYDTLSETERSKLKSYTGGGYSSINSTLRTSDSVKLNSGAGIAAAAAMKGSVELPAGSMLYRKHGGSDSEFKNLRPGHVVSDKGLLSTSSHEGTWGGNVQWKITLGAGVKGVPAKGFSSHKGENEVILPPNSRMLVTSVVKKSHYWVVDAIALPTQDNQCCPP